MKTQFILRTSIFVLLITFFISCKKEAPVPQDSTNLEAEETALISNDDNSAESAFYDLKVAGDSAGTAASTKLKTLKNQNEFEMFGQQISNHRSILKNAVTPW